MKKFFALALAAALFSFVLSTFVQAEEPPTRSASPLEMKLSYDNDGVFNFTPYPTAIPVRLTLKNISNRSIEIIDFKHGLERFLSFDIVGASRPQKPIKNYPEVNGLMGNAGFRTLKPGETLTFTINLRDYLNFEATGNYDIQAHYTDTHRNINVNSNTMKIRLKGPLEEL